MAAIVDMTHPEKGPERGEVKPDWEGQHVPRDEAFLEEALEESFPASDPPASNRID